MVLFFKRNMLMYVFFFFSSRRRHTRSLCDWSSDVCSSDLLELEVEPAVVDRPRAVGVDQKPAVGVGDEVGERAGVARFEADVGHADDRLAREPVRAHASAGALQP